MNGRDDDIAARREAELSDLGAGLGRSPSVPNRYDEWGTSDDSGYNNDTGSGMRPINVAAPRDQWKGRRRMAWIALFAVLTVTGLSIFYIPIDRIAALTDIIMWFFVTMGSIIGAYMGFTAWWARSNARR